MFNVGDKIVNKNGKVCEIVKIETVDYGVGPKTYYVLRPCFSSNKSLKIHVPVDQEANLRPTMTKEEVEALLVQVPTIDTIWYTNPKVRKAKFKELSTSGEPIEIFRLIKSFLEKKEEYRVERKALSFTDENFLKELRVNIFNEIAIALNMSLEEVENYLCERVGV